MRENWCKNWQIIKKTATDPQQPEDPGYPDITQNAGLDETSLPATQKQTLEM